MFIGAGTVFLIAHQPISYVIGIATLIFLFIGYGVGLLPFLGRAAIYLETIFLSLTVFLLMTPTVSETLRRVPDGHPLVTDLKDPLLVGAQLGLLALLVIGVILQIVLLRKNRRVPYTGL